MRRRPAAVLDLLERRRLFAAVPPVAEVARFPYDDGSEPAGGMPAGAIYSDASGDLSGVARAGGATVESANGTLWELAHNSSTLTAIAAFDPAAQPLPNGGVAADADGNLYGTFAGLRDQAGNVQTHGGVWQFSPATGLLTTLATFDGTNGDAPNGDATIDAAGNLYGTAAAGGVNDAGTVWELPAGATAILPLANFGGTVGTGPAGRVAVDATGNLFGTAQSGGANGYGTVWERPAGATQLTVLESFGTDALGVNPVNGLAGDGAGHYYGATESAGPGGNGVLFRVDANPADDVTGVGGRATLTGGVTDPYLTVAADGTVYGASPTGGPDDRGEVFRLVPDVPAIQPIAANQTHGPNAPAGPLLVTATGDLVGVAATSGAGLGAVSGDTTDPVAGGLYRATAESVAAAASGPRLVFSTVPSTAPVRAVVDPVTRATSSAAALGTIVVRIEDADGNLLTGDTSTVDLSLADGATRAGVTGATAVAVGGVATFADVALADTASFPGLDGTFNLLATSGADVPGVSSAVSFTTPTSTPTSPLTVTPGRSTVPATTVAGRVGRGVVRVSVATIGTSPVVSIATITVYASTTGSVDAAAVPVGLTTTASRAGAARVPVRTDALAAGSYTLLAVATETSGATSPPVSVGTLSVSAGATTSTGLMADVTAITPATVRAGRSATVVVTLTNADVTTATAAGPTQITVRLSSGGPVVAVVVHRPAVRAGRPVAVRVRFRVPVGTAAGSYTPAVSIVRDGVTTDAAAGTATLTVA